MGDANLLRTLKGMNPWWDGGGVPKGFTKDYRREAFRDLMRYTVSGRVVLLTGARRVGKTVLMHQAILEFIDTGTDPRSILYAAMDHPNLEGVTLEEVIGEFRSSVRQPGEIHVLLDEIQHVPQWSRWLKALHDSEKTVRFIVSGSSATEIHETSAPLLGRSITLTLPPFTFRDFVRYRGVDLGALDGIEGKDIRARVEHLGELDRLSLESRVRPLLQEYLVRGGFPEVFELDETALIQRLLREDVIDKAVYRDIAVRFGIKEPRKLESILAYIAHNSARILNKDGLSRDLGITKLSVARYLDHLKQAFLVHEARNYSTNVRKTLRSMSRFYICDSGVANAIMLLGEGILADELKLGEMVETVVFNHCAHHADNTGGRCFYFRTPQKHEVDIVLRTERDDLVPIEAKYRNAPSRSDLRGLRTFASRFGAKWGILVTKDARGSTEVDGMAIDLVPCWLFLLLL